MLGSTVDGGKVGEIIMIPETMFPTPEKVWLMKMLMLPPKKVQRTGCLVSVP